MRLPWVCTVQDFPCALVLLVAHITALASTGRHPSECQLLEIPSEYYRTIQAVANPVLQRIQLADTAHQQESSNLVSWVWDMLHPAGAGVTDPLTYLRPEQVEKLAQLMDYIVALGAASSLEAFAEHAAQFEEIQRSLRLLGRATDYYLAITDQELGELAQAHRTRTWPAVEAIRRIRRSIQMLMSHIDACSSGAELDALLVANPTEKHLLKGILIEKDPINDIFTDVVRQSKNFFAEMTEHRMPVFLAATEVQALLELKLGVDARLFLWIINKMIQSMKPECIAVFLSSPLIQKKLLLGFSVNLDGAYFSCWNLLFKDLSAAQMQALFLPEMIKKMSEVVLIPEAVADVCKAMVHFPAARPALSEVLKAGMLNIAWTWEHYRQAILCIEGSGRMPAGEEESHQRRRSLHVFLSHLSELPQFSTFIQDLGGFGGMLLRVLKSFGPREALLQKLHEQFPRMIRSQGDLDHLLLSDFLIGLPDLAREELSVACALVCQLQHIKVLHYGLADLIGRSVRSLSDFNYMLFHTSPDFQPTLLDSVLSFNTVSLMDAINSGFISTNEVVHSPLRILLQDLSADRIQAFLSHVNVVDLLIHSLPDSPIVLASLCDAIVLAQASHTETKGLLACLSEKISIVLESMSDFNAVMEFLTENSAAQAIFFCNPVVHDIALSLIQTAADFKTVLLLILKYVESPLRDQLLKQMQEKIDWVVYTPEQYQDVFEALSLRSDDMLPRSVQESRMLAGMLAKTNERVSIIDRLSSFYARRYGVFNPEACEEWGLQSLEEIYPTLVCLLKSPDILNCGILNFSKELDRIERERQQDARSGTRQLLKLNAMNHAVRDLLRTIDIAKPSANDVFFVVGSYLCGTPLCLMSAEEAAISWSKAIELIKRMPAAIERRKIVRKIVDAFAQPEVQSARKKTAVQQGIEQDVKRFFKNHQETLHFVSLLSALSVERLGWFVSLPIVRDRLVIIIDTLFQLKSFLLLCDENLRALLLALQTFEELIPELMRQSYCDGLTIDIPRITAHPGVIQCPEFDDLVAILTPEQMKHYFSLPSFVSVCKDLWVGLNRNHIFHFIWENPSLEESKQLALLESPLIIERMLTELLMRKLTPVPPYMYDGLCVYTILRDNVSGPVMRILLSSGFLRQALQVNCGRLQEDRLFFYQFVPTCAFEPVVKEALIKLAEELGRRDGAWRSLAGIIDSQIRINAHAPREIKELEYIASLEDMQVILQHKLMGKIERSCLERRLDDSFVDLPLSGEVCDILKRMNAKLASQSIPVDPGAGTLAAFRTTHAVRNFSQFGDGQDTLDAAI